MLLSVGAGLIIIVALPIVGHAQFPKITNFYGGHSFPTLYNGNPVPVGSIIDAYNMNDPFEIKVGSFIVDDAGKYGFIGVTNEGTELGGDDPVTFFINGRPAGGTGPDVGTFSSDFYAQKEVNLEAEGNVSAVFTGPESQSADPGDLVTYLVAVENTGNGIDFYRISATSSSGWIVDYTDEFTYIQPLETGLIAINLSIPPSALSGSDQIEFTVTSGIDESVSYNGTVLTLISPTDIDDDNSVLPDGFILRQNYPNPFNPGTVVDFELPTASDVNFEVYDLLGRVVGKTNLGYLRAGTHSHYFQAGSLASGIYIYRLKAGDYVDTKRMILLK
jgi:hypothetical protein